MRRFLQFITGLAGIVGVLAFVEFFPTPRYTYFWDRTYDTGHILVFGIGVMMAITMLRAFAGKKAILGQYVFACVSMLVLGLMVEVGKANMGVRPELIDVYSDLVGIVAFALIYAILDKRIENPRAGLLRRGRLGIIAGVLLVLGLLPYLASVDIYRQAVSTIAKSDGFRKAVVSDLLLRAVCQLRGRGAAIGMAARLTALQSGRKTHF